MRHQMARCDKHGEKKEYKIEFPFACFAQSESSSGLVDRRASGSIFYVTARAHTANAFVNAQSE